MKALKPPLGVRTFKDSISITNEGVILFVCTGNSCRSIMAEIYFKKITERAGLNFLIHSAGTEICQGMRPTRDTLKILKREKLPLENRQAVPLEIKILRAADWIFVMEKKHIEYIKTLFPEALSKTFLLGQFCNNEWLAHGPEIPDPYGKDFHFYEIAWAMTINACDQLLECRKALLQAA